MWLDSNNNTEVPANLLEEQASQSSVKVVAARSKAKAKPQKRETVVGFGKSARSHTVRLTDSLQKSLNRIMTKVLWLC